MEDRSGTSGSAVLSSVGTARQSGNLGSDGQDHIVAAVAEAFRAVLSQKFAQLHIDPFFVTDEEWQSYPPGVLARTVDRDGTITVWFVDGGIVLGAFAWCIDPPIEQVRKFHGLASFVESPDRFPTDENGIVPNWRDSLRFKDGDY